MAENSFDSDDSILLCYESGFDSPTDEMADHLVAYKTPSFANGGSSSLISLPCLSEETFSSMIDQEKHHMPRQDYFERLRSGDLDLSVRKQALDWMLKVRAHNGFGQLAIFLAMNYFDRIFSSQELAWGLHKLALACLSIGTKMAEVNVPSVLDLQVEEKPGFVCDAKSVREMELSVMKSLKWRMNPCTPFSFVDYFIRKMTMDDDELISEALINKAVHLISSTIEGEEFLQFKASEIAAAVAMAVVAAEADADAISSFKHVQKDRLIKCYKLLQDMNMNGTRSRNPSNSNSNSNPIGFLDCFEIDLEIGPHPKRAKLDKPF